MDSDAGALCGIGIVIILLFLNFIFSAFMAALQSVTDVELEEQLREDDATAKLLLSMKDDMDHLIHTLWLLNAFAYTGAGCMSLSLVQYWSPYVVIPVVILIIYLFGGSLPEMLGRKSGMKILVRRGRLIQGMMTILYPLTYFMTILSHICIRMFGIAPQSLEQEVTENEIISMVNEGHEQGVLDASEAEMIQNIFELDDKNASDIMTHRKNLISINGCTNLRDAISFMAGESVSRFPVYEENIDNVIGVLHFKDAMKFYMRENYENWLIKDIPHLLREARFIPETRGINDLFRKMQAEKLQMVLVADEYGQTAGLVTMEDILEEIVGNIQDEYDNEEQLIRECPNGSYLMNGMAALSDVADALKISFEDEEYDTLNGWLISRLDRIPSDGEQAQVQESGYLFQILKVENKIICLVKITKYIEEEKERQ